ncbi:MAG: hypothetical protein AAFX65_14150, partial [Cyanobacteria bacterium J06638_7]
MSITEYSNQRAKLGVACSYGAIRQAILNGKINKGVVKRHGRNWIDPEVADQEWAATTLSRAATPIPAEGGGDTRAAAQARRDRAMAEIAELDLAERRSELIAVARVDVEWFKVCRQIRDAIEA